MQSLWTNYLKICQKYGDWQVCKFCAKIVENVLNSTLWILWRDFLEVCMRWGSSRAKGSTFYFHNWSKENAQIAISGEKLFFPTLYPYPYPYPIYRFKPYLIGVKTFKKLLVPISDTQTTIWWQYFHYYYLFILTIKMFWDTLYAYVVFTKIYKFMPYLIGVKTFKRLLVNLF